MFGRKQRGSGRYRRGQLVVVRPLEEILATLNADGALEGLPFMPEMAGCCGRTFRVARRVPRVFFDHHFYVGRLTGTVLLEDARCHGRAHGGCQMACNLLWKEAWLRPAESPSVGWIANPSYPTRRGIPDPTETADLQVSRTLGRPSAATLVRSGDRPQRGETASGAAADLPTEKAGRFYCQATELVRATTPLKPWDLRQYLWDFLGGDATLGQLLHMAWLLTRNRLRWIRRRPPVGTVAGTAEKTALERLGLQPGELVEVRSLAEIQATLDTDGKARGLAFVPDMRRFCGKRLRVARRVDRMIVEWTGHIRDLKDTVALEGVTCAGIAQRRCPRGCFHLWREAWLRRVAQAEPARPTPSQEAPATFPAVTLDLGGPGVGLPLG